EVATGPGPLLGGDHGLAVRRDPRGEELARPGGLVEEDRLSDLPFEIDAHELGAPAIAPNEDGEAPVRGDVGLPGAESLGEPGFAPATHQEEVTAEAVGAVELGTRHEHPAVGEGGETPHRRKLHEGAVGAGIERAGAEVRPPVLGALDVEEGTSVAGEPGLARARAEARAPTRLGDRTAE